MSKTATATSSLAWAFDESVGDEMRVTVIATGIDQAGQMQTVHTPSGAIVTRGNFAKPSQAQSKASVGEGKTPRRTPAAQAMGTDAQASGTDLNRPTILRKHPDSPTFNLPYTPGGEEHCCNSEEDEVPIAIRRLAN